MGRAFGGFGGFCGDASTMLANHPIFTNYARLKGSA
jgi:hypothetical protein